jgi:fucose permease
MSAKLFFGISVLMMLAAMLGLSFFDSKEIIYICIGLIGFGNSNVFSIIFAQALQSMPQRKNEISGLMIMGLFGGTVFPLFMGFLSDAMASQMGAIIVLGIGVLYLAALCPKLKQ